MTFSAPEKSTNAYLVNQGKMQVYLRSLQVDVDDQHRPKISFQFCIRLGFLSLIDGVGNTDVILKLESTK